jgi:DNA polymerase-3 subunit epsilon/ATP-dependent DNA helicase DinG
MSIVAIDIETTGLDEDSDAIIEVGAVKFVGRRIEDEYSSLLNPNRHIPEFITGLTGIDDAMVRGAPRLSEVAAGLKSFVGDSVVLGHNVKFDLGFLRKSGLLQDNAAIDTFELAAVLLPTASRYGLGALGQYLGIPLPATHRALDDARVTQACYLRLLDLAMELPLDLVEQILALGGPFDWSASAVFAQVMHRRGGDGAPAASDRNRGSRTPLPAPSVEAPLGRVESAVAVNLEELASVLEYSGPFSRYFESYEHRPEQVAMLRAVAEALYGGKHLMVEAGTGVGKSLAYLVPAALFATQNNTRVVISTNTLNLQQQLLNKDIPDLQAALNLNVRAAALKGRANYLCLRRFGTFLSHGPATVDELRVLAKILVWRRQDSSGDRSAINLTGPAERDVWLRLSAEDDGCTTEACLGRMAGACPFFQARQAAQTAHLLVVNHALLLADIATGGRVLPEYDYLVVDEAHHLEGATTGALAFRMTQFDFDRQLKEVGGSSAGALGRLLTETKASLRPGDFGLLQHKARRATDQAFRLEQLGNRFFGIITKFAGLQRQEQSSNNYAWQLRITPAIRTLPDWEEVEESWSLTAEAMLVLLGTLGELYKDAVTIYSDGLSALEDVVGAISTLIRHLTEIETTASGLISKPSSNLVYWIEINPRGERLSLNAAPLRVGPLVEQHLWHEKASVVLTSATLAAHGEFQYLRNTLAADEADELIVGSPFDYEASTLLYVADDMPEPNMHGYQQALERGLVALAKATGGRMLVLFTSYATLKKTAAAITTPLAREDIFVFEQGDGASPTALLESFRASDRAVLLGTRAFWEGVDVPGEALSVLVLAKLPFDVPTDPLIAARSELYEDAFGEYYLPEAILKFRQGFGRLIRTASDRGVVAVLDRRLLSKQYGRLFLESLPQCTSRQGPLSNLPREASRWLGS